MRSSFLILMVAILMAGQVQVNGQVKTEKSSVPARTVLIIDTPTPPVGGTNTPTLPFTWTSGTTDSRSDRADSGNGTDGQEVARSLDQVVAIPEDEFIDYQNDDEAQVEHFIHLRLKANDVLLPEEDFNPSETNVYRQTQLKLARLQKRLAQLKKMQRETLNKLKRTQATAQRLQRQQQRQRQKVSNVSHNRQQIKKIQRKNNKRLQQLRKKPANRRPCV